MNHAPSRPLIAFALLKKCSETMRTDLLGGVALLIRPQVRDFAGAVYDSKVLADRLARAYGLAVPADALEEFVPRLMESGILVEEVMQSGAVRAVYASSPIGEFTDSSEEFQTILDEFVDHAHTLLQKTSQEIEEEELHQAFLRHLATLDFSALRAKPVVNPDPVGTLAGPSARDMIVLSDQLQKQAMLDAIVASFITKLQTTDESRFALLAQVADGALAAELVFDLRAPHAVPRLTNTTVVVDTPIILSALDLSSKQDTEDAKRLLAGIVEAGAKVAAFQHSIEEAEGVLSATNNARNAGEGYGPAIARFSNGVYRAFYESMLGRIASTWQQKRHFEIIQETATHFYKNFSGEDEEQLASSLRLSLLDRVLTRERDAKSVAETVRRLGGAHISIRDVSSCRYIFVTPNAALRRLAAGFLRSRGFVNGGEFVPVVTSRYLAGLTWLITGGKAERSPTTARLLANCAAALQLRPEIAASTKRFLAQIDPEKAEHFEALMTNERAAQYLAEATFNNPGYITANNVEDIYAEAQRRAAEKVGLEKDAFYGEKLAELESERKDLISQTADLTERLERVAIDAEQRRLNEERLTAVTNELQKENTEQLRNSREQENKISALERKLTEISENERANAAALSGYWAAARVQAMERADSWTRRIRIFIAIGLFSLTF